MIGHRHRKDLGDIDALVKSIREYGLFQPIGATPDLELAWGRRRLEAFRRLGRKKIPARIVKDTSIVEAEYEENERRKDFTAEERVAILETIKRKPLGDQRRAQNLATVDEAAKHAGFKNRETARQARDVVNTGHQPLTDAMNQELVSVNAAWRIATTVPREELPDTPEAMPELAKTLRRAAKARPSDGQGEAPHVIPAPGSDPQAPGTSPDQKTGSSPEAGAGKSADGGELKEIRSDAPGLEDAERQHDGRPQEDAQGPRESAEALQALRGILNSADTLEANRERLVDLLSDQDWLQLAANAPRIIAVLRDLSDRASARSGAC
jgi:hypothetical protein